MLAYPTALTKVKKADKEGTPLSKYILELTLSVSPQCFPFLEALSSSPPSQPGTHAVHSGSAKAEKDTDIRMYWSVERMNSK